MKNGRIVLLTLAATALLFVLADHAAAQTRNKESNFNPVLTEQQAQALPESSKVAMVCAKCKTVQLATEKKNFLVYPEDQAPLSRMWWILGLHAMQR